MCINILIHIQEQDTWNAHHLQMKQSILTNGWRAHKDVGGHKQKLGTFFCVGTGCSGAYFMAGDHE
jgi:hypothetical protein